MLTADRHQNTRAERRSFAFSRKAEAGYAVQLRKVARQVGHLVEGFNMAEPGFSSKVTSVLQQYAQMIRPWAVSTGLRMVEEVGRRDMQVWDDLADQMGAALRTELRTAPTGKALQFYLNEQVRLITSLPTEAAERVHKLTIEATPTAGRAREIAKEIQRTGEVTASRATLIARTEVARTSSGFVMTRAQHAGSKGYIWRAVKDADTRPAHWKMNGVYVDWNKAPTLEDGTTTHAGMIYNCRCWPDPIIPDTFE